MLMLESFSEVGGRSTEKASLMRLSVHRCPQGPRRVSGTAGCAWRPRCRWPGLHGGSTRSPHSETTSTYLTLGIITGQYKRVAIITNTHHSNSLILRPHCTYLRYFRCETVRDMEHWLSNLKPALNYPADLPVPNLRFLENLSRRYCCNSYDRGRVNASV